MVGIVIPLYLTRFIDEVVKNFNKTINGEEVVFCFVNDGKKEIFEYFKKVNLPDNMMVIHREENGGFAKANNSGWEYILNKYPDIEYIGTINDDTMPHINWVREMIKSIDKEEIGVVVPNIREFIDQTEVDSYAVFEYGEDRFNPLVIKEKRVEKDTFTKAMSGCCFIAKTKVLKEVEFFDDRYMNGCEDVDLSLKIINEGYKIIACANATITHLAGCSRSTKRTIGEDIEYSTELLALKWGTNYNYYNNF